MWENFGTINNEIDVVPYSSEWVNAFECESTRIRKLCQNLVGEIEHIGSTSIPGISAKPILDLMLGFASRPDGEKLIKPMLQLQYGYFGEFGIPGRHFFVLEYQGRSVVHAHGFLLNGEDWQRHLFFKRYLINHPEQMRKYEALKLHLAKVYRHDRKSYSNGKAEFIAAIENLGHKEYV
jgi:GrpB-like predicted nucleotidyltransferase (UPF0157 family)